MTKKYEVEKYKVVKNEVTRIMIFPNFKLIKWNDC